MNYKNYIKILKRIFTFFAKFKDNSPDKDFSSHRYE